MRGHKHKKMNKETRIFLLGFFWLFVGGFVVALRVYDMINGTWEHLWYDYVFLVCGTISMIDGLNKLNSVTKRGEE